MANANGDGRSDKVALALRDVENSTRGAVCMDKTLVGLIAAIGAMTPLSAARADVSPVELEKAMNASSFAELLRPIPNARAILDVADDRQTVSPDQGIQMADDYHHHHHHRRHRHHHHHHHYY